MSLSKDVVLHGSKIDWIITEKLEKLREIMEEDATFISLPPLGTESTVITVTGSTLPLIERSIRRMNKLVCLRLMTTDSRFLITSNSPTLFFPMQPPLLNRLAHCQHWHGVPVPKSTFPATVSRSTATTMPFASSSISFSRENSPSIPNIPTEFAFAAKWPTNYKNSLQARKVGKSIKS